MGGNGGGFRNNRRWKEGMREWEAKKTEMEIESSDDLREKMETERK